MCKMSTENHGMVTHFVNITTETMHCTYNDARAIQNMLKVIACFIFCFRAYRED